MIFYFIEEEVFRRLGQRFSQRAFGKKGVQLILVIIC